MKNNDEASRAVAAGDDHRKDRRTHDPRRVIEDIRNHLAVHDRCLVFFFGAGTSSAINIAPPVEAGKPAIHKPLIPGVLDLTDICKGAVSATGENQAKAWEMLAEQCMQNRQAVNIENILSRVRSKIEAIGDGETLVGLDPNALNQLEETIRSTIAANVMPSEEGIPEEIPHDAFVAWVQRVHRTAPIEIFTTNYDILFERAFEYAAVPVFDAFVGAHEPFFYPDCLDDDNLLPPAELDPFVEASRLCELETERGRGAEEDHQASSQQIRGDDSAIASKVCRVAQAALYRLYGPVSPHLGARACSCDCMWLWLSR